MEATELEEKVKDVINKGAETSKRALNKAGDALQQFSDRSVLKFEIRQLKNQIEDLQTKIGKSLSDLLTLPKADLMNLSKLPEDEISKDLIEQINQNQEKILKLKIKINEKQNLLDK